MSVKKITALLLTLIFVFALTGSALAVGKIVNFVIDPTGGGKIKVTWPPLTELNGLEINTSGSQDFSGTDALILEAVPNAGYEFDHWEVNAGDDRRISNTVRTECDLFDLMRVTAYFKQKVTPPPTLAQDRYTVSYHPNGGMGTVPMDMNRYYRGDMVHLLSGVGLSKPGHVFAGWALADGTAVNDPFAMPNKDVTLFAVWHVGVMPPKTGDIRSALGFALLFTGLAAAAFVFTKKRAYTK